MKKKYFTFIFILLLALTMSACKTDEPIKLENYPISDFVITPTLEAARAYIFSDKPGLTTVHFITEQNVELADDYALEMWDGTNWRTIHDFIANGATENVKELLEYESTNAHPSVNFSKIWDKYGEGLYRIVRYADNAADNQRIYVAKEIKLIDSQKLDGKISLGELFTGTMVNTQLVSGTENIDITGAISKEFFEAIMQLKCVGTQAPSNSVGPNSGCTYKIQLSDGTTITIRNKSGKTLTGKEYTMVCTITGMSEEILLIAD